MASGIVLPFAGATAPTGWLLCQGQTVSRTTYAALFAAIGTAFGVGDGSTTFGLPDMRGEFPRGLDAGRGVDAGRTLGSAQKGTIIPIDGTGDNQPYVPAFTSSPGPGTLDVHLLPAELALMLVILATTRTRRQFTSTALALVALAMVWPGRETWR